MMSKMKSKKSIASCGLQSDISAFFAKVLPKSPKRGTAMHTDMCISNVIKTSPGPDTRFPLSPLTIPETPEREKQHHCPTQLFSGASRSPVARSPRSRVLLLRPHKTSPKSGDIVKADISIEHFGSAKRLMHGSEKLQKAKRPRTGPIQPSSGKNSSSNEDGLSEFLQAIRETANSNDKKSAKAFSKAIEEKSCHAEQTLFVKNRSTLPDMMLRNITSAKESGANEPKDHNRNKRGSHSNVSSSLAEEKENIPVCTKPSTDLTETSIYNQSDLVMSYTSWSCDGDDGKKEEDAFVRVNEKNSQKATNCSNKVTNLGDKENTNMTAEESFGLLDDSWFNDQMEQSLDEPDHKKSKLEKEKSIPEHVILASGLHNRYWVLDVQETTGAQGYTEKRLTITCSKSLHPTETCVLKDGWEDTPVAVGDIVHLEGECVSGLWMIDSKYGFLVLLPDVLVSGTSIANTVRCMRRAVLGEMFKSSDGGSRQMLNGTIVHDIFQKAAMSLDFSPEKLEKLASEALHSPNYLGQMYSLKLTQADMRQELEEYLTAISEWAKDYVHTSHQTRQKQLTMRLPSDGALSRLESECSVTVTDFVDIEENIWSPRFGLKGKIDVTAGVRIHRRGRNHVNKVVPLELKTGKESNSIEHRSQVILYTLMSTERRTDAEVGFLVYLKTGNLHPIVGNHMDRRELIKLRNSLVHHLRNSLIKLDGKSQMACLPEVMSDQQTCKYCPQRRNCALYYRAVEKVPAGAGSSGGSEAPQAFLQLESEHLNHVHLEYFSHWLLLCSLEALTMESKEGRRNIWLQSAHEREKNGGCVGNMVLAGGVTPLSDGVYAHHFKRKQEDHAIVTLIVGDRVVISDQNSRFIGIASGYITEITNTGMTCNLDKNLSKYSSDMVFRLDHDEGAGGLSAHLGNLSMLMENSPNSERLRQLIVEFQPPKFIDSLSSVLPREAKDTVANILKGLNKPQKQAMKKVLLSKDYTLIVGMPGTGKTTTICTLVRILHACGFSVLLTSYTHSAVDNILLKLKKFKVGFLRLGRTQKVHRDLLPFTEEQNRTRGINTVDQLEDLYSKELVVATTCMGVKHPIFSRRRFDFCIVDEASQISQPVCLGPLFYAQRFVLVGDHQQLPPIVQNAEARALGMDESLFKRLEHHRQAVVQLNVQYRMNSMIMSLSNALMYEGRLECGSERTANAQLQLPCQATLEKELDVCQPQSRQYTAWVYAALEPRNSVCFLDTSQVPAIETVEKGGVSNRTEAILVHALISLLIKVGCRASDIGVIAPYRQQLKAISALLEGECFRAVEVNTVDKYQGRDKSVIIVSFVRNNTEGNLGELLKDWRRLNVAITRAKHKLLMLGSAPALRLYAPLEKLLTHMQQENMIYQLPPAAHEALPRIKM